jgi:hypothetical protein
VDNPPRRRPRPGPSPGPGRPRPEAPRPSAAERRPEARFVPDRRYTALAAGGGIGALVAVLITGDVGGRLLAGIAVVLLLAYVASDLVFSPRVVASSAGVVINSPLLRARLTWAEIEDVRPETRLRLGLRSTTLEIDAGTRLAVLSRRAIGADPLWAADRILAFRPPAP